MSEDREEIRIGLFVTTSDNFILNQEAPDGRSLGFLDVTFEGPSNHLLTDAGGFEFESRFNHKRVSILGRLGKRNLSGDAGPEITTFFVRNMVTQAEIAKLAFEIHQSGRGGSALDDWLRAERQLLETNHSEMA
jgi:hypothetical protein